MNDETVTDKEENDSVMSDKLLSDEIKGGHAPGVPVVTSRGSSPAFLSCWDIHSYYGESYIVQGISFDIHEGEIVALLGRNGAGKTSTLRTIARMDAPSMRHGEIWLDHQPLQHCIASPFRCSGW